MRLRGHLKNHQLMVINQIEADKLDLPFHEVEVAYDGTFWEVGYTPDKPRELCEKEKRNSRDYAIKDIEWRIERYRQQSALDELTTDDERTYRILLEYVQYLRDFTNLEEWWLKDIPSFDEFLHKVS